jgi:hypothetical protein
VGKFIPLLPALNAVVVGLEAGNGTQLS